MKVQLIVVQGKPEGKIIPLAGPVFRIGRGETCQLKPNSEQVSREHAEFQVSADSVMVRDLGSRNGTLVNGKAITEPCRLKDRDLVQVGPLTFAVAIQGAPATPTAAAAAPSKPATPEDVSHDDIESWLVSDAKSPTPERPSGVYDGDTLTMAAFKDAANAKPKDDANAKPKDDVNAKSKDDANAKPKDAANAKPKDDANAKPKDDEVSDNAEEDEYERLPEGAGDEEEGIEDEDVNDDDEAGSEEEFVDESNPFYVKKKAAGPEQPAKPVYKDTSDAANEILKKMMERRRSSK